MELEGTQKEEYRLVGIMLGLAIYNNVQLEVKFPAAAYKRLCGQPVGLEDLCELDPDLGNGLAKLLTLSKEELEGLEMTFEVDVEVYGENRTFPLGPNGENRPVTVENRQEYIDRYVQWIFVDSVKQQYGSFQEGFHLLCQGSIQKLFRPEELELIVCGSKKLDFKSLEEACKYDGGFTKDTPLIKEFWKLVHNMGEMDQRRLLTFVTGCDRAPAGGLGQLTFTITRNGGDSNRLPTAHTCFNTLLLNEYGKIDDLRERLMTAIRNDEGFGLM
ncbi:MAG: ubiquitin-protein ligase E3A-like protein [Piptocephalis tieghemiana]|nr:MAG: ubiquitin-protein ligase E3A-like protein [Piptocephalis tieghemiana]